MSKKLTHSQIQTWLRYWQASKTVNVDSILAFDQVWQARKFCPVMQGGVFENVSDLEIWRALHDMREPDPAKQFQPQIAA